jgi:hypothetical protein
VLSKIYDVDMSSSDDDDDETAPRINMMSIDGLKQLADKVHPLPGTRSNIYNQCRKPLQHK